MHRTAAQSSEQGACSLSPSDQRSMGRPSQTPGRGPWLGFPEPRELSGGPLSQGLSDHPGAALFSTASA